MPRDTGVTLSWGWHQESGRMRHVDSVPRGKASGCVCKECGEALVAKKGEARKRRYHFAHASSGQTGGRETCLHWNGVWTLYQRFQDAMQQGEAVPFRWVCNNCKQEHIRDFAEGMTCAKREKRAPDSQKRPDISLYSEDELRHLIEVVVYHRPEPAVHDYARGRGVSLVVVDMKEAPDLDGTIKAEMLEGSVCLTKLDQETLAKAVSSLRLRGDTDLMASRYEAESGILDIPGLTKVDGFPMQLKEGEYAVGVLERIRRLPGVQWVHVHLRYPEDPRFLLPVMVPDKCEDLRDEAALIGKLVLMRIILGPGVNFVTGYPLRRYRIIPLQ